MSGTKRPTPTIALISLGCPKNQVDSELILSGFLDAGFEMVAAAADASVVVVNTCGFIGPAKEEAIDTILEAIEAKKARPGLKVLVAGCLFQRYPSIGTELPEVDYWLSRPQPGELAAAIGRVMKDLGVTARPGRPGDVIERKVLLSEPGSAYLRISEGCGRSCGFCAIPAMKGPIVSETIDRLVSDARWLIERFGVQEINLVAQDLAAFGTDRGKGELLDLLRALDDQTAARWYRLLYAYPMSIGDDLFRFVAGSRRFAHYLDVPFQHADAAVLKAMRRGGSFEAHVEHVREIRRSIPDVALRTTLLVGHPGETERRFETLLDFIHEARFEWMGVFPFSREEGTPSARLKGAAPGAVAERRASEAMDAFREARRLDAFRLGQARDALVVEDDGSGQLACRTETEAPEVDGLVFVPSRPDVKPGQIVRVRVEESHDMDFGGRIVHEGARGAAARHARGRPTPVANAGGGR